MNHKVTVRLSALGPIRFRWWGDFSPVARGPIVYAKASPIPLPSTVTGAIISALRLEVPPNTISELAVNPLIRQYSAIKRTCIKMVGPPIIAKCSNSTCDPLVLVGSELLGEDVICEVSGGTRTGISIERSTKAVLEGYLYMEELIWGLKCKEKISKKLESYPYTILVELTLESQDCNINIPPIIHLGGERVVFEASTLNVSLVESWLKRLWGDAWNNTVKKAVVAIASPLILNNDVLASIDVTDPYNSIKTILINIIKRANMSVDNIVPLTRCAIAGLGLGYDVAVNLPRPYKPVILPGCTVLIEGIMKPKDLYHSALGEHAELGWSRVIPLPQNYFNDEYLKLQAKVNITRS